MTQPELLYSNDITLVTATEVNVNTGQYCQTITHIPFVAVVLYAVLLGVVITTLIVQFQKR